MRGLTAAVELVQKDFESDSSTPLQTTGTRYEVALELRNPFYFTQPQYNNYVLIVTTGLSRDVH